MATATGMSESDMSERYDQLMKMESDGTLDDTSRAELTQLQNTMDLPSGT